MSTSETLITDERWAEAQVLEDGQVLDKGQAFVQVQNSRVEKGESEWGNRHARRAAKKQGRVSTQKNIAEVPKQQQYQQLTRPSMSDEKVAAPKSQLEVLSEQRATLSLQYAEVALQLRVLEQRERELGASLRLVYDQIKLAQESGNSAPQPVQPEPA